jgi:hypothetical protein
MLDMDMDSGIANGGLEQDSSIGNPAMRNALWQAFACSR